MILNKWNYKSKKYEPYKVPDSWNVAVYKPNMEDEVDCAICGRTISFGESYSSPAIHTSMGIGYCVCGKCHGEEIVHRLSFIA